MAENELTLVGTYSSSTALDKDSPAKARAMLERSWSPDTQDFLRVARAGFPKSKNPAVYQVKAMPDLLYRICYQQGSGKVQQRSDESLKRVNLITHGDDERIGLTGYSHRLLVIFGEERKDVEVKDSVLDKNTIAVLAQQAFAFKVAGKNREVTWAQVRRKLARNAELYIYACKSGQTPTQERRPLQQGSRRAPLLTALKAAFGATVFGFLHDIEYDLPADLLRKYPREPCRWQYRLCLQIDTKQMCTTDFHEYAKNAQRGAQLIKV